MFRSFRRSWELVKASFNILRSDPELLAFPLVSAVAVAIYTIALAIPLFLTGLIQSLATNDQVSLGQIIPALLISFTYYFGMYIIVFSANTALVGAALMRMDGKDPTLTDGLNVARARLNSIIGYAAISAVVSVVINLIRDQKNSRSIPGQIIASLLASMAEFAWRVVTFLVIPVIAAEGLGPMDAIKRSAQLLKETWGSNLIGSATISLIFVLITFALFIFLGIPLFLIIQAAKSGILAILGVTVLFFAFGAVMLIGGALSSIYQAALYRYATTHQTAEGFDESYLREAFRTA